MTPSTGNPNSPSISVVVPTCNRSERLPRLIQALEKQVDAPPFEVIVVDDGSVDNTWTTLQQLAQTTTINLRPLRLETNRGPSSARNAGWRAACAWAVALTDDDCVPQPHWLAELDKQLRSFDLVQGRTVANPEQADDRSWFSHTVEVEYERGFYETCNIAYRRSLLERLNGFDEVFHEKERGKGGGWGDDTDLGWRAKESGARTAFASQAVVWHDIHHAGLRSRLRALPRQAGLVLALKRNPGLRESFESRWFYQPSHPRALALLAGLILLAFRPRWLLGWILAALLSVPWLKYRGSMIPRWRWRRYLPRVLVFDLAETGVFVVASIRHRTFLL
jgi:GT2 family glycosyltransferase